MLGQVAKQHWRSASRALTRLGKRTLRDSILHRQKWERSLFHPVRKIPVLSEALVIRDVSPLPYFDGHESSDDVHCIRLLDFLRCYYCP